MFSAFDHQCMSEALRQAERGLTSCSPNPRVGCVLAKNDTIIASGWHRRSGGPHAEVGALESAGKHARGSTAYVTLEPCSHQGKTPPCAHALVKAGVTRVVAATVDNNPRVNGAGLKWLQDAGIQVESGLCQIQAEALNAGFFKRMRQQQPWLRVKLAISLDGHTALANGDSQWISGAAARADVQHWRARSCAVMTGIETVLADDPSLNVRLEGAQRQPLRVIVDSHWRTPADAKTLQLPGEVLIAGLKTHEVPTALQATKAKFLRLPEMNGRVDLHALMKALAAEKLNEVQLEAGATLAGGLLAAELVDEILLYQAPVLMGHGGRGAFRFGPLIDMQARRSLQREESIFIGDDQRIRLRTMVST